MDGPWICPTSCRNAVITPNVMAPCHIPKTPHSMAAEYPKPKAILTAVREKTLNLVLFRTWSYSVSCNPPSFSSMLSSCPMDCTTVLCCRVSWIWLCTLLSDSRISFVSFRMRLKNIFPKAANAGVISSRMIASFASIVQRKTNAAASWIMVIINAGKSWQMTLETTSTSVNSLLTASPLWNRSLPLHCSRISPSKRSFRMMNCIL